MACEPREVYRSEDKTTLITFCKDCGEYTIQSTRGAIAREDKMMPVDHPFVTLICITPQQLQEIGLVSGIEDITRMIP